MPQCFLLLLFALSTLASGKDWPRWRGPDLNGISSEKGLKLDWEGEPERLWTAKIGSGYSSVSVAGGKAYVLGLEEPDKGGLFRKAKGVEVVRCLDLENGEEVWAHRYPSKFKPKFYDGGTSGTPTVDGDKVFVFGQSGELMALNAADGKVIWEKDLAKELGFGIGTWGLTGSPLVYGDLLILNAGTHGTAVKKSTGETVWSSGGGNNGYATPVPFEVDGENLLAIFSADGLHAVEPKTGKLAWTHPWETRYEVNAADPVVLGGGRLFISSGYGRGGAVLKVSRGGAEVDWENTNIRTQFNPAVLIGGYLYGIDGNTSDGRSATLKCIDPKSGAVKWSEVTGFGGVAAVGDTLVVLNESGELITGKASPDGFKELARTQAIAKKCWTIPTIAAGKLLVRNQAGTLVCFDLSP